MQLKNKNSTINQIEIKEQKQIERNLQNKTENNQIKILKI